MSDPLEGEKIDVSFCFTLPETNSEFTHEHPHGFLVNTIKMVDFPWRFVSFREGKSIESYSSFFQTIAMFDISKYIIDFGHLHYNIPDPLILKKHDWL